MSNTPFHDEPGRCLHCQQPLEPRALDAYCSPKCRIRGTGWWEFKRQERENARKEQDKA